MLIQNGMGVKPRDLNVEYSGYVALALGIGGPFISIKRPLVGLRGG